ncbi:hypothetical protein NDU88_004762 [Pleurodeles waltl]|uniref:Uncharacterized protein n=1 Tax=Pleurodeles waltl TaxID=8319 RepID=A0AAV7MCL9_PLEWA|nr:hypothetical protein NDU88_004762 [Pleurodeles waltl]
MQCLEPLRHVRPSLEPKPGACVKRAWRDGESSRAEDERCGVEMLKVDDTGWRRGFALTCKLFATRALRGGRHTALGEQTGSDSGGSVSTIMDVLKGPAITPWTADEL